MLFVRFTFALVRVAVFILILGGRLRRLSTALGVVVFGVVTVFFWQLAKEAGHAALLEEQNALVG